MISRARQRLQGPPLPRSSARHSERTVIASLDDQHPKATPDLVRLALRAAEAALGLDLSDVAARAPADERGWVTEWPGEHYRLLAALGEVLEPALTVEVGTFTGMGSLSLLRGGSGGRRVITYDVVGWQEFSNTLLTPGDFDSLEQRLGDLSDPAYFDAQRDVIEEASLIFVDGPKDSVFEPKFFDLLVPVVRHTNAVIVVDDIRLPQMVRLWRDLPLPKLDVTSFGHWSGTGLAASADYSFP